MLTAPVHRRAKAAFHFIPWMFTRNLLCSLCLEFPSSDDPVLHLALLGQSCL